MTDGSGLSEGWGHTSDHMGLARQIAARLHRSYYWVNMDDLHGYAYLGLALAAKSYQPDRGVPFVNFASQKALFLAIDVMRKDGLLRRRDHTTGPFFAALTANTPCPNSGQEHERVERLDLCVTLLKRLGKQDRHLLTMYYADDMTFKEIAKVFEVSVSAVSLRHKALIARLRRLASVTPMM